MRATFSISRAPTPYHYLTRSRGSSKTSDLAAFIVAILLTQLRPGDKIFGVGADRDQARLMRDAALGYIRRTPGLVQEFDVGTYKITARKTAATFEALAADAPGAWGLLGKVFVLDEVAQYAVTASTTQFVEAITSAAAKISDARMIVLTTAGSPSHPAHKLLEHAKSDGLWRVHEVPGPSTWMDPSRLEEQKRRLPESSYRRLFLNEWVESEDMLTTLDDLKAAVTLNGPQEPVAGRRYVVGLDVGLKADRTVACVCHVEDGPFPASGESSRRVVLDRIAVWQGSRQTPVQLSDVEAWLLQASKSYNNATIVLDIWQAAGTQQRLRGHGVRVVEFTFTASSVGKLAVALHNALRNRQLALPNDEALLDELANVRIRETSPNTYRLDHDEGQHDRAISLALCVQHLLDRPPIDHRGIKPISIDRTEPAVVGGSWRDAPRPA